MRYSYEFKLKCVDMYNKGLYMKPPDDVIISYDLSQTPNEAFSRAIEEYIDYYNNKRIQAKTKRMLPVKYREASMCCN